MRTMSCQARKRRMGAVAGGLFAIVRQDLPKVPLARDTAKGIMWRNPSPCVLVLLIATKQIGFALQFSVIELRPLEVKARLFGNSEYGSGFADIARLADPGAIQKEMNRFPVRQPKDRDLRRESPLVV